MSDVPSIHSGDDQSCRNNNNNESNNVFTAAPGAALTSVFIGLGPAAATVSEEALRERLEEVSPVLGLRIRGYCAFADVPSPEDADQLVARLDGEMIGEARMVVQISRNKEKDRSAGSRGVNNANHGPRTSLFVGLGPSGGSISDRELRGKLEEVAPLIGFRRRGQCAFVDVADMAQASRMIQELNNQYIGDCRLSVQHSRDKNPAFGPRRERRARSSERRHGRQRSRRRHSPERRRYRRHRSRSSSSRSSPSSRSSSYSDDSRDRRRRDRRRRERSRSYSDRSRSSSLSYRRRRD